jgi:hypothetical protein
MSHPAYERRGFVVDLGGIDQMLAWHDQNVRRCYRVDVAKGNDLVVLVDKCRRNLTSRYTAKDTVSRHEPPLSMSWVL